MRLKTCTLCGIAALLLATAGAKAQLLPAGPGLRLSSSAEGDQRHPSAATGFQGRSVVVWQTPSAEHCQVIHGQRLSTGGELLGFEFPVSDTPFCDGGPHSMEPVVGVSAVSSLFVASWGQEPDLFPGATHEARARRFDFFSGPRGASFLVDGDPAPSSFVPGSVAFHPTNDQLALSWNASFIGTQSTIWRLRGRSYGQDGTPVTAPFPMANGLGSVVWGSRGLLALWAEGEPVSGVPFRVFLRRFTPNGTPVGAPFTVAEAGSHTDVAIARNRTNGVLVVWTADDGAGQAVWARLFNPLGAPRTNAFRVSTVLLGSGARPAVSSDGTSFLVVWDDGGDPPLVHARQISANGAPVGGPFRVDPFNFGTQANPTVAGGPEGEFFIVWEGYWPGASFEEGLDILGQRFAAARPLTLGHTRTHLADTAMGHLRYFRIEVPSGARTLRVVSAGGTGNADLFLRHGALPTTDQFDLASQRPGSSERMRIANPPAGTWYVGVRATAPYAELSLLVE